jgi:hypothetical protein
VRDAAAFSAPKQKERQMYALSELDNMAATVRAPIQCEGIERGHRRIVEAAVSGSVNPQFDWGSVLGTVAKVGLPLLTALL